jgi:hypothetical protein
MVKLSGVDETGLDFVAFGLDSIHKMLDEGFDNVAQMMGQCNAITQGVEDFRAAFLGSMESIGY